MTRTSDGLLSFFALACAITWTLSMPATVALVSGGQPATWMMLLMIPAAFGPTLAAVIVAAPRGEVRAVFGRWGFPVPWVVVALLLPLVAHLGATVLELALGGQPSHWLYLPDRPERVVALVLFSVGEEFGWRGFAGPRVARRFGQVRGPLILGAVWALWHATMMISPVDGSFDANTALVLGATLPLWSVVYAAIMARTGGSMAVALALHAGAHLDNIGWAPAEEVRLRVLYALMAAGFALVAARSLARHPLR